MANVHGISGIATGRKLPARPRGRATRPGSIRPLLVMFAAMALELLLLMPFADTLAQRSATFHFTQHGLIFLGGVLMGAALRDAYLRSYR